MISRIRCLVRSLATCRILVASVLPVMLLATSAGHAEDPAASSWQSNAEARVRLISATDGIGPDESLRLGLQFDLVGDWKTYWRTPGDAGFPAQIDWSGSTNLRSASIAWPVPHRFQLFGLQTFGYGDEVVLPIDAVAEDPDEPTVLRAQVKYLVCRKSCIPHTAELELTLPPGAEGASDHAHLISRYRSRVPGEGASTGLALETVRLAADGKAPQIDIVATAEPAFRSPDAIVEGLPETEFDKAEVTLRRDGRQAVLRVQGERAPTAEGELAGKTVTVTVFDGTRGLERTVTLRQDAQETPAAGRAGPGGLPLFAGDLSLADGLGMLAVALLGGLILNLMPCVLPVLSLKLMALVELGGRERRHVRLAFLASAAGIVFSFLLLAAAAAGLKALGVAVGWGIQFQQPLFLIAMTVILTVFAANVFGVFEVRLPAPVANALGRSPGGDGARGTSLAGHFAVGALAALLATPCSAPFLGTAVAFALSRGVVEIAAIFAALGLGLALPYLAVAAVPSLANILPRPGRWMILVRWLMGAALAGTAVWLLSVLAAETSPAAAWTVGGLMLALPVVIAIGRGRAVPARWLAQSAAVGIVAAAFLMPAIRPGLPAASSDSGGSSSTEATAWRPLDREVIDALVDNGRVVFVDVTADWCITCKVNKRAVIESDPVQQELDQADVVRMRGDWTTPSPRITDYLAAHGRYGVPFNAVYGPEAPEGLVLPEILSRSAVIDAIERAGGGAATSANKE